MTIVILLIPMLLCYVLLIAHALYTEGKKFTIAFFGGLLLFGIMREMVVRFSFTPYSFNAFIPIFQIINVPIAIGWTFATYISFWFGRWIFQNFSEKKNSFNLFLISCISGLVVMLIVFAIEYTAPRMGWWSYNPQIDPTQPKIFGIYLFLFFGWSGTVIAFLFPFQFNFYSKELKMSKRNQYASLIVIPFFFIALVIGNYLLLNHSIINLAYLIIPWILWVPIIIYLLWRKKTKAQHL